MVETVETLAPLLSAAFHVKHPGLSSKQSGGLRLGGRAPRWSSLSRPVLSLVPVVNPVETQDPRPETKIPETTAAVVQSELLSDPCRPNQRFGPEMKSRFASDAPHAPLKAPETAN